jgi:uncharacterized protein (TIGR03437 family)
MRVLACLLLILCCANSLAATKKILYLTTSAGFRHDSIEASVNVLHELAARSNLFEVEATEDLGRISRQGLSEYDAVLFFTSGELNLATEQKTALVDFVRSGKSFGGFHSATDTLYTWPEYEELIGARFDGHPWTQEVSIDVEDSGHPASRDLAPSFKIVDEIYQHRDFSRSRSRVLMTLDTSSVDLRATGVNRTDRDFPLAWVHPFGQGRVFYTALGHLDQTWMDARFQTMIENALLWLLNLRTGEAAPRPAIVSAISQDALGNAATLTPPGAISPGAIISIFGANLTTGSTMHGGNGGGAWKLAGTEARIGGKPSRILFASPSQLNVVVPLDLEAEPCATAEDTGCATLEILTPSNQRAELDVAVRSTTPGIFLYAATGEVATLWATGLGVVQPVGDLWQTAKLPKVKVNGREAQVLFSGLAPGWFGLYQVNIRLPASTTTPLIFEFVE